MRGKQILFFSTREDIESIMKSIEKKHQVKYFEMGLFDLKPDSCIQSVSDIQTFGYSRTGDWNKDLRLIVLQEETTVSIREVVQRTGDVKFAIDTLENQNSVFIQFGGIYQEGILLAGSCGTVFYNDFSKLFYNDFSKELKKEYKKIGSFYVGKEAEKKLEQGWRLVTNVRSPKEYDLKIN